MRRSAAGKRLFNSVLTEKAIHGIRCVLTATVAVKDQFLRTASVLKCLFEEAGNKLRAPIGGNSVTEYFSRTQVNNDADIKKTSPNCLISVMSLTHTRFGADAVKSRMMAFGYLILDFASGFYFLRSSEHFPVQARP